MALSKLTPELMIFSLIARVREWWNSSPILPPIIHCDCQDTEMNNETECYFYFSDKEGSIDVAARELCRILRVPVDAYIVEHNDDTKENRVEIICELTINGKKLVTEN